MAQGLEDVLQFNKLHLFDVCEDVDVNEQGNILLLDVMRRFIKKHKPPMISLTANQVGHKRRLAVLRPQSYKDKNGTQIVAGNDFIFAANPYLIEQHGDPVEKIEKSFAYPNKRLLVGRFPEIKVTWQEPVNPFESDGTVKWVTKETAYTYEDPLCDAWQHVCEVLDGVAQRVEKRDVMTMRNEHIMPKRNEPCPCRSGLKFKKYCLGRMR